MLSGPPCLWEMWAELGPNSSSRVWGAQSPPISSHFSLSQLLTQKKCSHGLDFVTLMGGTREAHFMHLFPLPFHRSPWHPQYDPLYYLLLPVVDQLCLDSLFHLWGLTSQTRESTPTLAILGFRGIKLVMLHQFKMKKSAECLKWRCSLLLVGEWSTFLIEY